MSISNFLRIRFILKYFRYNISLLQKAILKSKNDGFSSLYSFLIYNFYNAKDEGVINEILELIRINRNVNKSLVLEADYVKDFLKELNEKKGSEDKRVYALVDVTLGFRDLFAECYTEDLAKLSNK
jgi:hypothetical protein